MGSPIPGMILAAGRGERMRPLTDQTPKPLLTVKGKCLIDWHLDGMLQAGFERVVVNHAWLGDQIRAHIQNLGRPKTLATSPETQALETAGGIKQAENLLEVHDYFFVINGDIFCPTFEFSTIAPLANRLREIKPQTLAYLYLVENPAHNTQGDFGIKDSHVIEKENAAHSYTFSGIGIYHKDLFKDLVAGEKAKLAPLLKMAIQNHQVMGELLNIPWTDVGTPERLAQLNQ
jgi:MurNAc alpha-1-phosphate uridylyltransferase